MARVLEFVHQVTIFSFNQFKSILSIEVNEERSKNSWMKRHVTAPDAEISDSLANLTFLSEITHLSTIRHNRVSKTNTDSMPLY